MPTYLNAAEALVPAFLEELRTWVDIDSGSFEKAGIDRVGALVRRRFEQSGFVVSVQAEAEYGDQLVARRVGSCACC